MRTESDPGLPLSVKELVCDVRGDAVHGATLEIWHADYFGRYDIEGYRFRRKLVASTGDEYGF